MRIPLIFICFCEHFKRQDFTLAFCRSQVVMTRNITTTSQVRFQLGFIHLFLSLQPVCISTLSLCQIKANAKE